MDSKASAQRPVPIANGDSAPYWEAAKAGRLALRRCRACAQYHFMPRYLCPECWSSDLEWVNAVGRGTVHTFSVVHRAPLAEFTADVPYVVALIDLEEGPRMMANIVGDAALDVKIGDPVAVCFEARGDMQLPQFRRVQG